MSNALMDIIDEYKFKIQEAKDVIAYLEVELEWVYWRHAKIDYVPSH